jgi:chromosome segregation ATPase
MLLQRDSRMEQIGDPCPGDQPPRSPCAWGELVVHNGRLSGTRRPLTTPVTTVGRAESCDVRLNVDSIQPFHCVLASGPTGLMVRNLHAEGGTLVNGQAVRVCTLHEGDLLSIGPFEFQVHLPEEERAAGASGLAQEKEALRIQAAAVVAQQAALTEEEIQLQHRRIALEQQEQQLAAHLEERRRRLVNLRDEARAAHAALQQVRTAYEERVAQIMRDLAQSRQQLSESQRQIHAERQHLLGLRQRLKRRFHRHWLSERMAMRLREAELTSQRRDLDQEKERLQQEKASLLQARLRLNGDSELGRRRLQEDEENLRRQQAGLQERAGVLDFREKSLDGREKALAVEKRHWEETRSHLQQEAQDLETRVTNWRRKLLDHEQEFTRRKNMRNQLLPGTKQASPPIGADPPQESSSAAVLVPLEVQEQDRPVQSQQMEAEVPDRLATLQRVAGELADQRLQLAEQYERLGRAQHQWQQDRDSLTGGLEALAQRLQMREEATQLREQTLAAAEYTLRQRAAVIAREHGRLEAAAAQLTANAAIWEGERERLLAGLRAREERVEQDLAALSDLRARWARRRQRQVGWLRAQRNVCAELRRESETLRHEWLRRSTLLGKEQRALAERALALEQYRQRWIARAAKPKAAEKRLERLRRRSAALTAEAERTLAQQRKSLESQAARLEERARQVQQDANETHAREAELSAQQDVWEQEQLHEKSVREKMRQEVESLRQQRHASEQRMEALREEVERLARLLLEDTDSQPLLQIVQAA